jgi:hypothetical protein
MEYQRYIFICKIIETNQYFAGRKVDIDRLITSFEENVNEKDLPFTTVARIKESGFGLQMGFPEECIDWYEKKEKMPDRKTIDGGVMAVLQFLQNGFIF